jgi:hypothetical protein
MRRSVVFLAAAALTGGCSAGGEQARIDLKHDLPKDIDWTGRVWTRDYFAEDDYLAWSNVEALYRVGRLVKEASERTEMYATFAAVGRGEPVISRDYVRTRPAEPPDLARMRKVFVPASVHDSPTRALTQGGPRHFAYEARRETWLEFEILNTSELDEGRVNVRWGERIFDVPIWSLRVAAK